MTQVLGLSPALRLAQKTRTDGTFNPPRDKKSSQKCASWMGEKDFEITIPKTKCQESEPHPHSNGKVTHVGSVAIILEFGVQQTWFKQVTQHVHSYSKHCSSHYCRRTIGSSLPRLITATSWRAHSPSSGRESVQPKCPSAWRWLAKPVSLFWALQKA